MGKKGFTLVELLVVISIIALLLAILMPALQAAKKQASSIVCLFNERTLGTAWFAYTGDNRDKIVSAHTSLSRPDSVSGKKNPSYYKNPQYLDGIYSDSKPNYLTCWVEWPQMADGTKQDINPSKENEIRGIMCGLLFPYIKKIEPYHCPGDRRLKENKKAGYGGYRTYSIAGSMDGYYKNPLTGNTIFKVIKKYMSIPIPSRKYVFVEENWVGDRGWNLEGWQLSPVGDSWTDPVSIVHGDKSIVGYADSHAEAVKWKDKRTIRFAKNRLLEPREQPNNPDLQFMQAGWAIGK